MNQAPSDLRGMETPGQRQWEPAPEHVLAAPEAASAPDAETAAVIMLSGDDPGVAVAACKLLGAALRGLDRLNRAEPVEQP